MDNYTLAEELLKNITSECEKISNGELEANAKYFRALLDTKNNLETLIKFW